MRNADRPRGRWGAASLAVCALLTASQSVLAIDLNGFQPEAGMGQAALSYTAESYDEFWVGDTRVSDPGVGEVETTSTSLWLAYGFTDRLAVFANLAHVDADSDGLAGFSDSGLQDGEVLVVATVGERRRGAVRHRLQLAAGLRTPLSHYEANLPVDLGDGSTDSLFRVVYQLAGDRFYFAQQVGMDLRSGDVPDGFPLATEFGWTFGSVTASAHYWRYFADGGSDIGDPGFTFPGNGDETSRVGAKLYARLGERFGLAGSAFVTLDGRNAGDADGLSLGAVTSF